MVLVYFKKFLKRFKIFRGSEHSGSKVLTPEERLERYMKPYQRYLLKAQDIIFWEQPSESLLAVFVLNVLFWVLACVEWRFYGIVFTLALLGVIHEAWTVHIWPEIRVRKNEDVPEPDSSLSEGKISVHELSHYAQSFRAAASEQLARLSELRSSQPGLYCALMSGIFLVLAGIGRTISTLGLLYILAMAMLLIPGAFIHLLPAEKKQCLYDFIQKIRRVIKPSEGSVDVDDYLPETSKENMELFALAGDMLIAEKNGEAVRQDPF